MTGEHSPRNVLCAVSMWHCDCAHAGTTITVLSTAHEEWWEGENEKGDFGFFPRTFVELHVAEVRLSLAITVNHSLSLHSLSLAHLYCLCVYSCPSRWYCLLRLRCLPMKRAVTTSSVWPKVTRWTFWKPLRQASGGW